MVQFDYYVEAVADLLLGLCTVHIMVTAIQFTVYTANSQTLTVQYGITVREYGPIYR